MPSDGFMPDMSFNSVMDAGFLLMVQGNLS
jgi:hypothetical protein